ncbi:DUF981 family protein [Tenacibaculum tangerinum]|uniref:DUF981 family protein n=1 Tax=Tenacibaculum tangerinum TaxID=3038772 RepID=A0ABY8L1G6_9FLAO|nr:DUF981 family protein [Tenacibaculum tangerinum]WGH75126.1 DUF981 family protein [Tenacibaculum tangerinum]
MAVVAGAGLLSLWSLFSKLNSRKEIRPVGIALNFAVIGIILFITGVHTTLTWPLSPTYPFDNSAFGEPCFVFGALLLAMAFYFWKEREQLNLIGNEKLISHIFQDFNSFKYILVGLGLGLIMIGIAGIKYKIFIAPPEEPIVGPLEKKIPYITTYMIGLTWMAVGVAAIGFVAYMNAVLSNKKASFKWLIKLIGLLGIVFMLIGVTTYYSHIGMEINTMDPSTVKPNVIMNPDEKFQKLKN